MGSNSRHYFALVDLLRIYASVAVVRHHMRQDWLFGVGIEMPLFLIILFALGSMGSRNEGAGERIIRKGGNLLVPWVRWSAFYLLLTVSSDYVRAVDPFGRISWDMLLVGGNPGLWFLPFAAFALVPSEILQRVSSRLTPLCAVILFSILGALSTIAAMLWLKEGVAEPFPAWVRSLPAIPWGLALGRWCHIQSPARRAALGVFICGVAALAAHFAPPAFPPNDIAYPMAVALPLLCLAFGWRIRLPRLVRQTASLSFGVYLAHPLVGKVLVASFDVFSWSAAEHTAVTWGLAAMIVLVLRQIGLTWEELRAPSGRILFPIFGRGGPGYPARHSVDA